MRPAAILTPAQCAALRRALAGRRLALCFGAGVDSTAMIVALHEAGITPDVLTFANTGGERAATLRHLARMNQVVRSWGWPAIIECRTVPKPSTGYVDLYGNCIKNETLPSLAFGMKSCSLKWKASCQDQMLKGVKVGPNKRPPHAVWLAAQDAGERIVKLIGYDSGKADVRRAQKLKAGDSDFDFAYPLQIIGWNRRDCIRAIARAIGADMVPVKSACFFCPATKHHELFFLAADEPELLEAALLLERNALTGRHSRFDVVEFGATWEDMVRNADSFPSSNTTVGLGRSFAWNQWARVNNVVDAEFKVIRAERAWFLQMADALRGDDNSLDARSCGALLAADAIADRASEPAAQISVRKRPNEAAVVAR